MALNLPALEVTSKQGEEAFSQSGSSLSTSVKDFWRWSCSDLMSNATRGILAEYIVACDLGVATGVRAEWDAFDLTTRSGIKVEVKSSAYLQTWYQRTYSAISFSITPTIAWDAQTGNYATEKKRQGDVYIFCLLHHKDQANVNPLDMDQWTFYVLATQLLDTELPKQQTLSLSRLLKLDPVQASYGEIDTAITSACSEYGLRK